MTEQTNAEVQTERIVSGPEVHQELSKVKASPKQTILILVGICGIFGYLFFNLFLKHKATIATTENAATPTTKVSKPVESKVAEVPKIPQLPELPKLIAPKDAPPAPLPVSSSTPVATKLDAPMPTPLPPPMPTPLPEPIGIKATTHTLDPILPSKLENNDIEKRKESKRKSTIILVAGAIDHKTQDQIQQEADFTERGAMEFILGRGKIIDAVLETAVNSDIGGEVRAVISRDVFSESSKIVLIPKGARVFGSYDVSQGTDNTYGRISIIWNRIDLANGYIINLSDSTPAVDNLGRKGIQGRVDNKFKEQLSNAVLMSAFNIAIANALDKIVAPPVSSQATTTNSAIATNIQNIVSTISNGNLTEDDKVNQICAQTQAAITDKTSSAYTSIVQACTAVQTNPAAVAGQKLSSLTTGINAAVSSLLTAAASAATPTQSQSASKQAFTDVTNTFKDMVTQQQFKPTVTIDQGTLVKIYVSRDYKFPKAALRKMRLIQ